MSSLFEGKTGIIAPKRSWQKQKVVIQFLLSVRETAQNISRRLNQVYDDGAIDYSTVTRWVKRINNGQEESAKSDFCDWPRSGRPFLYPNIGIINQISKNILKNKPNMLTKNRASA